MRPRLHRALARLAALALVAGLGIALSPTSAGAATMVRECKVSSIGCVSFSGYNGRSVWGYPVNSTGNNCVNYVAYRLRKNGVPQLIGMGNGGSWAGSARSRGYRVDHTPRTGSIAQWSYGSAYAPGYGHVGYVEEVTSSYIVISDSSWGGNYSSRWRIPYGDRNWPSNFIHFKDTGYQPPPTGTFLQGREDGAVYRMAGGAPMWVTTWTAFGGRKATHLVSTATIAALPRYPRNGTYLLGAQRREVYVVAAGAPVYVSAWANVGGRHAYTTVDQNAIDRAGSGGRYNHLAYRPVDGSFIHGATTKRVYQVKGGVAYYVSSWTQVGGRQPTRAVDQVSVNMAGTTTPVKWTHVRQKSVLSSDTVSRSYSRFVTARMTQVPLHKR
jgi:surface antigen